MNIDVNSNCKVVSKYFAGNTVMDESLDFQEKKTFKGPKNSKATAKPKAKKVKRIKGQKDIRTALKPKKNDLIVYSKDFDLVCKKSGIDVDSEQLQLAIALSKSLQHSEAADGPSSSTLTTQQRTGQIRSTLKEYGFKIPEITNVTRKNKKRRKPYKLLLTSEKEKKQIISDRYSQLLFELDSYKSICNSVTACVSGLFIYNMATNIEYKDIKDNDVFYVENLIEKSPNTMGCLLKKWSDIPGRLQSPTQDKSDSVFSEIECSQEEIDIVLSGSLKSSKYILKKRNLYKRKSVDSSIIDEQIDKIDNEINAAIIGKSPEFEVVSSGEDNLETKKSPIGKMDVPDKQLLTVTQPARSFSPDLFDDDEDTVVEINSEIEIPVKVSNVTEASDVMDLTECVNVISQKIINSSTHIKPSSQLSREIDLTKRKSNDYMEMTECVGGSSQPILERIDEHIDLTAHYDDKIGTEKNHVSVEHVEHMDLTQSSNSSTDTLPFVHISGKDHVPDKSLDDTILLNDNDYVEINTPIVSTELNNVDIVHEKDFCDKVGNISTKNANGMNNAIDIKSPAKSKIEIKEASIICLDESCAKVGMVKDNIDLTQTSDTKEEAEVIHTATPKNKINNSSLGKRDNVSVDYDDALENINSNSFCAYDDFVYDNSRESESNFRKSNKEYIDNESKQIEILKLSDNEVNTENNNDSEKHFNLGSISVIHHLSSFNSKSRNTMDVISNGSMSESLPMVDIRGQKSSVKPISPFKEFIDPMSDPISDRAIIINDNDKSSKSLTPEKEADRHVNIETPKNTEYIVKTDNVTPMLDYAAMTSPERNKELDKYGLKPFKRKRAIQLLTHLYNQTHPYVESIEELPSPCKKRKYENLSQPSTSKSPRKVSKSPVKTKSKSPRKGFGDIDVPDKENDIFTVTNETPSIRHIDCAAEDWIFQKREKAKLHTCRVPLHVAFHNFVSCRTRLHDAILRYEPVSIDVLHRQLAASGHRYDPKDLLKFMDKKCITVKTADNVKNKNRY